MVKAFRQKSFSFKRLHYSIKNYTKTVIPYSLSQELMTAAFTAALNGIYLFIIPMGIWIGSSTTDYQSFVASILMKVLYAFVNAMQVGNAVEHMDQVLAEPEIPERSTEL